MRQRVSVSTNRPPRPAKAKAGFFAVELSKIEYTLNADEEVKDMHLSLIYESLLNDWEPSQLEAFSKDLSDATRTAIYCPTGAE